MSNTIRIIAAVVDTRELTMYKEDGESIVIPQGDPRIRELVAKLVPAIEADNFCDLEIRDLESLPHYGEVELQSNGFIKFYRVLKSSLKGLLEQLDQLDLEPETPIPVADVQIGTRPALKKDQEEGEAECVVATASTTKAQTAVSEIMANAIPASSAQFHDPMTKEETVVAVMPETGTLVSGVEKLDIQIQGVAAKLGSAIGVQRFFERVASVKRNHSVSDLLTFMQKGELPIADDGSVLVYKRLEATALGGVFVDCHSKKVTQRVGSHVFMDEKLVDANRRVDCSNGLHVARRDYLTAFYGDVTVLAKLAPEDVIAVPHSDARKLRAKGYHIIARLSDEDARLVNSNRPMADTVLLGNAVAGNHVGIIETVEITESKGGGLIIKPVTKGTTEVVLDASKQTQSLDSIEQSTKEASQVDAVQLAKSLGDKKSGRQQVAEDMMRAMLSALTPNKKIQAAKDLMSYKKAAKVSWERLGITPLEGESVLELSQCDFEVELKKVKQPTNLGTPKERLRALIDGGISSIGSAQAAVALKKKAKKSWAALGVSTKEQNHIEKLASQ
ncbi:MAG: hypothetical protein WC117_00175 [Sphaerochaetaceae bacterium]